MNLRTLSIIPTLLLGLIACSQEGPKGNPGPKGILGPLAQRDPKDHPVLPGRPQLPGQVPCVSSEVRALLAHAPHNAMTMRL